jgi:hypothetical protein
MKAIISSDPDHPLSKWAKTVGFPGIVYDPSIYKMR